MLYRHMVLLSWFILTVFIIATYVYGGYKMDGAVVLFIIFFLGNNPPLSLPCSLLLIPCHSVHL